MKKILLIMDRKVLSDALLSEMDDPSKFVFYTEYNYIHAQISAVVFLPDTILMEIPESQKISPDQCLDICDEIRSNHPECKILLLTPEGNQRACELTIKAVQEGRVDDFLYYDTSMKYLVSKLRTM